ncbi:type II toxin-antitoxin system HipA family toxin [Erwiniaceae bacterium BAC15a-03b]|uniref:Type II toxin-antitoxin system HipA family toxin n=1 Tax=Winslowiella arboricola TaxID=2978220 RepID=A0A9J6PS27_9GAMM|nr:type II toxin-antitoxin system HipA family toxin [Winslowiella arboricola]MCU5773717.1 type II toxin-antitoxin system HipA family toxin [Winslowiella arboricola]MCU5778384.1 type II toxin-antitoxin system HipA family toxin [Winslowiella arboricola]
MDKLIVALNGITVGVLEKAAGGEMSFIYDADWLERTGARAISLSLPLQVAKFRGHVVYNFFDNLLPDNEQIRRRIQSRFKIPTRQPFDLLSRIGSDCVGAVQLYSEGSEIAPVTSINAEPLSDKEVEQLLQGYKDAPLGMEEGIDDFRISLAGAQEKTALLWYQNRWQRPQGSTPTSHIIKLPIGYIANNGIDLSESVENEWLCLKIAQAYGLPAACSDMARFGEQKVLVVERFDRRWSQDDSWLMRLPQEDFCQALGVAPALKYESDGGPGIADGMKLLLGSQHPVQDRDTFFKSQILFWMLAAIDGHAKNFSLFIEPGSAYRMTPLYDVMSAFPLMNPKGIAVKKAKMAMAMLGRNRHFHWHTILPRHFISTAQQVDYPVSSVELLMSEMKRKTAQVITDMLAILPHDFPENISEPIFQGLTRQATRLP